MMNRAIGPVNVNGRTSTKAIVLALSFLCTAGIMCGVAHSQPGSIVDRHPFQVAFAEGKEALVTDIAVDGDGNFTVVWDNLSDGLFIETDGIWARRYAANGTPRGPKFRVTARTDRTPRPESPSIAMTSSGNFVVVWFDENFASTPSQVRFRRYDAAGVPLGAAGTVDTGQNDLPPGVPPQVAIDSSGNFVLVWAASEDNFNRIDSFAQLFFANGTPRGSSFRINQATADGWFNWQPGVAIEPAGNFVVVWQQAPNGVAPTTVRGRRFAANGSAVGKEFAVIPSGSGPGDPFNAVVAMDGGGNFVVAFHRSKQGGPFGNQSVGIYARRFSAAATPMGAEFRVSKGLKVINRGWVAVDMNAAGEFALAWQAPDTLEPISPWPHTRLYNADGTAVTGERSLPLVNPNFFDPRGTALAMNGQGDFIFSWAQGTEVLGQRVAGPHDARPACRSMSRPGWARIRTIRSPARPRRT